MASNKMRVKVPTSWGMRLLGVWVVLMGLVQLLGLHFSGQGVIMGLLGVAAGALLLTGN